MRLTQKAIDGFVFEGRGETRKDIRWDSDVAGFGVRVWPSGKKTYFVKYRFGGRQRYLTLGSVGVLTLIQARDLARLRLVEVLTGVDPQDERRRLAIGQTVSEVVDAYLEKYSKLEKGSYTSDECCARLYVKPQLGSLKLKTVSRSDLVRFRDKVGLERGLKVTANRCLALFSTVFTWASDCGLLEAGTPNPAKGLERFTEVARERFVTEEEMPRLADAIRLYKNPFVQGLLWLYLLTGMRRSELRKLSWSQVDLENARLRVGETKGGRPLHLPLPPPAVKILRELPVYIGCDYVFPGRGAKGPITGSGVDGAWQRTRERAKLDDVRLHDLRHTLASWMVNSGVSLPMIGRVLNHSSSRTTQRYAHLQLGPVAKELEAHGNRLIEKSAWPTQAPGAAEAEKGAAEREPASLIALDGRRSRRRALRAGTP